MASLISYFLPDRAATVQQLGHPSAGVIGFVPAGRNTSGEIVTEDLALNYSAVWCATRVIAETVASLPCILYRRRSDGGKERATDDPRYSLVHDSPNDEQGAYSVFEAGTSHMVNWGNSYAKIERAGNRPISLELRMPETTTIYRREDGVLEYTITDPREEIEWPDMLHTIGLSNDGIVGESVVRRAQQSIGSGIAQEKYAGGFFGNGATPRGAIVHPERLKKEAREQYRREWDEIHGGPTNSGKVAILHGGITYQQLGMSHEDAQFIESRQFSVTEMSRWYRLPPHFLGDLTHATFSNIEHQSLDFVKYSMLPWLKRWESSLSKKLLRMSERRDLFFEFLVEGLLRADTKTRNESNAVARNWGWKSVNEIRAEENLNPVDGGDIYLQPLNMIEAGTPPPEPRQSQVPDTISAEFQQNIAKTIDEIRELAGDLAMGTIDLASANGKLRDGLSGLRDEREQMRKDLANLGTRTQVNGRWQTLQQLTREMLVDKLDSQQKIIHRAAKKAAKAQVNHGLHYLVWIDSTFNDTSLFRSAVEKCARQYADAREMDGDDFLDRVTDEHVACCRTTLLSVADGDAEGFLDRVEMSHPYYDPKELIESCTQI